MECIHVKIHAYVGTTYAHKTYPVDRSGVRTPRFNRQGCKDLSRDKFIGHTDGADSGDDKQMTGSSL